MRGYIEPVAQIRGDVGIVVIARNVRRRRRWAQWLAVECSSRVVVFRPTDGARSFARTWADTIETSIVNHDEHSMAWAYLSSPGVHFDYIPQEYSGRELGTPTTVPMTGSGGRSVAGSSWPFKHSSSAFSGRAAPGQAGCKAKCRCW